MVVRSTLALQVHSPGRLIISAVCTAVRLKPNNSIVVTSLSPKSSASKEQRASARSESEVSIPAVHPRSEPPRIIPTGAAGPGKAKQILRT